MNTPQNIAICALQQYLNAPDFPVVQVLVIPRKLVGLSLVCSHTSANRITLRSLRVYDGQETENWPASEIQGIPFVRARYRFDVRLFPDRVLLRERVHDDHTGATLRSPWQDITALVTRPIARADV
jgi:hypothetical protein